MKLSGIMTLFHVHGKDNLLSNLFPLPVHPTLSRFIPAERSLRGLTCMFLKQPRVSICICWSSVHSFSYIDPLFPVSQTEDRKPMPLPQPPPLLPPPLSQSHTFSLVVGVA